VERAVDAQPNRSVLTLRLKVNVARALLESVVEQVLDRGDDVFVGAFNFVDGREAHELLEVAEVGAADDLGLGRAE
jgi:hypothetical protein